MPYVSVNQQQIFYIQQQITTAKPTLLLLHGAGGSSEVWPQEWLSLPQTNVYTLDLPGHARSDKPGRSTIEAYTDDVAAFIDVLALNNLVVIGHSMGGAIAQMLALRHVPPVTGLVLIGAGARLRVAPAILDNILPNFQATIETIMKYSWSPDAPAELVDYHRQLMMQTEPNVLYGDYLACDKFDVMNRLEQIDVPSLVITGTADRMTPPKYGQYLAEQIPQARFVAVEGAGHFAAQEQPDKVAAEIERFLDESF